MRKVIAVMVAGLLATGLIYFSASAEDEAKQDELILRVLSFDPDVEITFEGAFLFMADESLLETVSATTPFEVKSKSKAVVAIFKQTGGKAKMSVEVIHEGIVKRGMSKGSAQGEIVILMNGISKDLNDFILATR